MSGGRPLRGACSCGRNHYVVNLESTEGSHVFFDDSSENSELLVSLLHHLIRGVASSIFFYP
jgi:hypothetical protein